MRSHAGKIAISLGLTAVLLFFFIRGLDPARTREAVLSASPAWLAASLILGVVTFILRAVRWTWLLRPIARVRIFPAFRATAIGFAANNLPGKVGEVLRPAILARTEKLPFAPLLASVALERVFDGGSVLFYLLLAVWLEPRLKASLGLVGLLPAAVLLALILVTLFAVFRRKATERFFEKFWRRLPEKLQPRVESFAVTFIDGLASLRSPALLAGITAGSLVMWFVINLQIYSVLRAFRLDLPLSASYVVTAAAVLGLAVPTPGGLGSYQTAVAETLKKVFGVAKDAAAGVAILAWATSFILITAIGLGLLALSGRERALARAAEKMAESAEREARDEGRG
jgi:uncharacterized protein (TIRG00374 family)